MGMVARAAAIFNVQNIYIYTYGSPRRSDLELMRKVLEYAVAPPYLKRRAFRLDRHLRYVGLLPPVNLPVHQRRKLRPGDVVEGIVDRWDGHSSLVYVGEGRYVKVPRPYPLGKRLLVRVEAPTHRPDTYRGHAAAGPPPSTYMGYNVRVIGLRDLFGEAHDTVVLTGREGRSVCGGLEVRGRTLVVFGSPREGVDEILAREGLKVEAPLINFVPGQGVETIRTEEAIYIVLAVLHYGSSCRGGRI